MQRPANRPEPTDPETAARDWAAFAAAWPADYEEITFLTDARSGLRAILVLHDRTLGPALGGIRCARYPDARAALDEALDLARGMTLKVLLAELPCGGAKCVVLDHPGLDRKRAFERLGEHIDAMGGRFFTAADLGTNSRDLRVVAKKTRHVATADHGVHDDLAQRTAEGVFLGAGTALDVLGQDQWRGVRLAIQGLGAIGLALATQALRAGATVIGTDVDAERAGRAVDTVPLTLVAPDRIWDVECDVFAPCARSHVLDVATVERLHCRIVCGAANQQLATPEAGDRLATRGILYAPDLLVNAGAVIMGCGPALPDFARPKDLSGIGRRLRGVLVESLASGVAPHRIALARAEARLAEIRGQQRGG